MMDEKEARCVLESLACLHSHYWGRMHKKERGTFWVLSLRETTGEVESGGATWEAMVDRFPQLETIHPEVRKLGLLLKEQSQQLDRLVEEGAVTRVHGDAKGWNFFFGRDSSAPSPFLFIDMQWTGRGHPLQDVAYALTTTLSEEALPQMDQLVDEYVGMLEVRLKDRGIALDKEGLRAQYDQVWLDYARVIVCGLWKKLDQDSIVRNRDKVGPSMINRSWAHVEFITRRLCRLLL